MAQVMALLLMAWLSLFSLAIPTDDMTSVETLSTTFVTKWQLPKSSDPVNFHDELVDLKSDYSTSASFPNSTTRFHRRQGEPCPSNVCDDWIEPSTYAICPPEKAPYLAYAHEEPYTICCREGMNGYNSVKHDPDGFKCCEKWDFKDCVRPVDVVACNKTGKDGKEHNITDFYDGDNIHVC